MVLFHSMKSVTVWTVIVAILLIWFGSRRQPLFFISTFGKALWTSRPFLLAFTTLIAVLALNKWELAIEHLIPIHWDFTAHVYHLEGQFVYRLQQLFNHPIITQVSSFFYIVVFQTLIIGSLAIYITNNNMRMAQATCYAIVINYLVAIPFYLFVPVSEVWTYPATGVTFRLLDTFPGFEESYRSFSGLDNCFPSLHTSISVTIVLCALQSCDKRWSIFTMVSTLIIVFSTFYLGIHWLTDMAAGVLLAVFASWLGMKWGGIPILWGEYIRRSTLGYTRSPNNCYKR